MCPLARAAAQSATPPLYGAAAGARVAPEATELVADAAAYIPGEIKVIEELPQASPFSPLLAKGLADEALRQLWLPPPRFAVMSTSGVLTVARRRPLEVLKARFRAVVCDARQSQRAQGAHPHCCV